MTRFKPATKLQKKVRLALVGPSGAGKTWTSLAVASELGNRTALLDTERGRASLYADEFRFSAFETHTYDPSEIPEIVRDADTEGFDTLIIDTFSAYWSGTNGMLEQVNKVSKSGGRGGSNFAGWTEMRPVERRMIDALLAFSGHIIVTMRVKTEYVVEEDDRGKKVPRKVGLGPEQRNNIEHEFDVFGYMDVSNEIVLSGRCPPLQNAVISKPRGADIARPYLEWLGANATPDTTVEDFAAQANRTDVTREELLNLHQQVQEFGLQDATVTVDGSAIALRDLIVQRGKAVSGAVGHSDGAPEQPAWDQPNSGAGNHYGGGEWPQPATIPSE